MLTGLQLLALLTTVDAAAQIGFFPDGTSTSGAGFTYRVLAQYRLVASRAAEQTRFGIPASPGRHHGNRALHGVKETLSIFVGERIDLSLRVHLRVEQDILQDAVAESRDSLFRSQKGL